MQNSTLQKKVLEQWLILIIFFSKYVILQKKMFSPKYIMLQNMFFSEVCFSDYVTLLKRTIFLKCATL